MEIFFAKLFGTVTLRWYTFAFLATFLWHSAKYFGWRRTWIYLACAYAVAWICEKGSITVGIPFGEYHYISHTQDREFWVGGVPFFDSLSFVFLGYFSYWAGKLWMSETPRPRWMTSIVVGGFLMMVLDIIIDPATLQGHKWFLGQIYYYPNPGPYFGVTLENFAGWFSLGCVLGVLCHFIYGHAPRKHKMFWPFSLAVYLSIAYCNIAVAFYIQDKQLGWAGIFVMLPVTLHYLSHARQSLRFS